MKIVIDIPEEDYKFIKDLQSLIIGSRGNCKTIQQNVINAIRNGIPYEEKPKYFPPCEDCNKKMEEIRQAYDKMKAMERPTGEWVRKVDVIQSIAKQYSEHDELVPMWLNIGDMKGGEE